MPFCSNDIMPVFPPGNNPFSIKAGGFCCKILDVIHCKCSIRNKHAVGSQIKWGTGFGYIINIYFLKR